MNTKRKYSEGMLDEKVILDNLKITTGQRVVDAGCGNGYMAKKFAALVGDVGKVYAFDPNEEVIEILKRENDYKNLEIFVGDISLDTGLENESIDIVYLSTVFHIFSDEQTKGFNREINRLLCFGGRLAVVNIDKKNTPFGPPYHMRVSPEELIQRVQLKAEKYVKIGDNFYMQIFTKA